VTEVRLVGGGHLAYLVLLEEQAFRACRVSLVPKVLLVRKGYLASKEAVEHQDHLVLMDLLELSVCLEQRVQRGLLELTGQMVKQDHQGQMALLGSGDLQAYPDQLGYQDNEVHREHKEKGVTVVLPATWERRDLQVFKDLQDPLDQEVNVAKVDLAVPKELLVLVEELETRDPLETWVQLEFQV
jgi:hypothetical protein